MGLEPGTTKDDVRRCLENWNKGDNGITVPVARLSPGAGHRLADRSGHPARARLAADLRAAGEQRRLRDVPVGGRGPRSSPWELLTKDVPPEQHARSRLHHRACSTGTRTSNPRFGESNRVFPEAGASRSPKPSRDGLPRAVGARTARGWYSAKELTVLPKRTRDDQGRRRVRTDPDAGLRHVRQAAGVDAGDDPVRTDDGGRGVRDGRRGAAPACESRTAARPIRS